VKEKKSKKICVCKCVLMIKRRRERGRAVYVLPFDVNVYRKVGNDKLSVGARGESRELPRAEVGGSSWSLDHDCCGSGELSVVLKI